MDIEYFNMMMDKLEQQRYKMLWETGIPPMFLTDPEIIMDNDDEDNSYQKVFVQTYYELSINTDL